MRASYSAGRGESNGAVGRRRTIVLLPRGRGVARLSVRRWPGRPVAAAFRAEAESLFALAMGLVSPGSVRLDLLGRRSRGGLSTRARRFAVIGAVAALFVALLAGGEAVVASRATRTAEIADELAAMAPDLERIAALRDRVCMVNEFDAARTRYLDALRELSVALPSDVHLSALSIDEKDRVRITGFAQTSGSVAAAVAALNETDVFGDVRYEDIRTTASRTDRGGAVRRERLAGRRDGRRRAMISTRERWLVIVTMSALGLVVVDRSTRGKMNVLSRPHILTLDNKEATITVGNEVPFVRNTRVTDEGSTYNTVEYEDVGIILTVTPHVNSEGWVILEVTPEVSAITDSTVSITEGVTAPIFTKRTAETSVAVRDGQTIVIGGMMRDSINDTVKAVPVLGQIPVLGGLFRQRKAQKEKTELLVFITPYVIDSGDDLREASGDILDRARVLPSHTSGLELR